MGEKLVIGPINKGLRNDRTAFVIDNDNFPTLINAYQWRGRVKRKRGTEYLGRLERYFDSGSVTITLDGSGNGNLISGFSLEATGSIVPGTVTLVSSTPVTYTDPTEDGYLTPTGTGGPNTINYASGAILIPAESGNTITAVFNYYPGLPAMGIEDFIVPTSAFPSTLSFDTIYSYNVMTIEPYGIIDVSFYNNPSSATYAGYVAKSDWTPTTWNGQNYQQFYTVNYQGALWATNGIDVPFTGSTIGMQFNPIISVTVTASGPPAVVTLNIASHGLVVGDFLFINEVVTTTGINFQTGYVISVIDANDVSVEFPNATITTNGTGGIAQYLTNRSNPSVDCLRWYNGNPTNGGGSFFNNAGWVNFMPPLSQGIFSISDEPTAIYYLVGARIIIPFKDRLLFMGPVVQTSSSSPIYLQDTVIYSQNGTAFYTASYTNFPSATADTPTSTGNFYPILVPENQTATPTAYFEDQTGFGGYIQAGIDYPITTAAFNEDVIIVGFQNLQTRLAYSGNDIVPFNFFSINTEYGSSSTFSTITLDQGVMTHGDKGYIITGQTNCQRFDLDIPDQVFEINAKNNGTERFCAYRDFINEWIYFTYPADTTNYGFPTQTLQYNYRDNSWAIFNESYTTYGAFRSSSGMTWETVGLIYPTWEQWNVPWTSGETQPDQPLVLGGNQQGFLLIRGIGTGEGTSLYISNISANALTVTNHCLNSGDYIVISSVIGPSGSQVNGNTFSVSIIDNDTISLSPPVNISGYVGGGLITRIYVPQIQTKQFPIAWDMSRKTRIGSQSYLLSTTTNSQISLLIYLSQNSSSPYNSGPIVPDPDSINDSLIYSTVLYTCPESTNLGLTPANINLQIPTANNQAQTWHRINTSLIGDTVQLGFTLSDSQVREEYIYGQPFPITGATQSDPCILNCTGMFSSGSLIYVEGVTGMSELNGNYYLVDSSTSTTVTIDVDSSAFDPYEFGGTASLIVSPTYIITAATQTYPCVLDCVSSLQAGQSVFINNVEGMTELNGNYYQVISANGTTVTIDVDSSAFSAYISGGTATLISGINTFAEIELHSIIMDIQPSQLLV